MAINTPYSRTQHSMKWSCHNSAIHIDITKQPAHLVQNINFQPCSDHPLHSAGIWIELSLNELSIESKNTQNGVRTKKLWPFHSKLVILLCLHCKIVFVLVLLLFSLFSLFFLSLSRLPNTPLEDDNSRDAWLSLLPLKRKEASFGVGLSMLSSCTKSYG